MHKTSDSCILGKRYLSIFPPLMNNRFVFFFFKEKKKRKEKKEINYCNVFGLLLQPPPSNLEMKGEALSPVSHLPIGIGCTFKRVTYVRPFLPAICFGTEHHAAVPAI